jgi:hypothetical protein
MIGASKSRSIFQPVAVCCLYPPIDAAHAEDWSQFRGTNAIGVALSSAPLPAEFSTEQAFLATFHHDAFLQRIFDVTG